MRRIAILGASSRIAGDLILWHGRQAGVELHLFVRRPQEMLAWLEQRGIAGQVRVRSYQDFGADDAYFAAINFVGVGDPAKALSMGPDILELTHRFDSLALDYVQRHPCCRYVFMSSGAAYGSRFETPAEEDSFAIFPLNALEKEDWYGMAKAHAECRHRAHSGLPIMDIRIFNYISETQDLSARFLVTDAIRAIRDRTVLMTSADRTVRDYLHARDFCALIDAVLAAPPANDVIDCYSKAPIEKAELLQALQEAFGLRYEVSPTRTEINATGRKPCYYSLNRRASRLGYRPELTSLEGVLEAVRGMLA
ncbi:epimerase [Laribacter hongkongensis]|uniref:NAD-dependent epimerase/dehydratase family protein n=1 Tax=Laribacter hongkongensis TaxID=168471 RepID=UPI0018787D34|nr:NAD(P)-dependent oxidoreductase [Laribacter hongkongensis]MBE5528309.1 epimerase [Laribacter hongkongensis]